MLSSSRLKSHFLPPDPPLCLVHARTCGSPGHCTFRQMQCMFNTTPTETRSKKIQLLEPQLSRLWTNKCFNWQEIQIHLPSTSLLLQVWWWGRGVDWSSPGEKFKLESWKNPCFVTNWEFLLACCFSSAHGEWYFNIPSAAENPAAPADLFSCSYHNKLLIIHKYHQMVLTRHWDHLNQSRCLSSYLSFPLLSHLPSVPTLFFPVTLTLVSPPS